MVGKLVGWLICWLTDWLAGLVGWFNWLILSVGRFGLFVFLVGSLLACLVWLVLSVGWFVSLFD